MRLILAGLLLIIPTQCFAVLAVVNAASNTQLGGSTTVVSTSASSHTAGNFLWVVVSAETTCTSAGTLTITNTAGDTWSTVDVTEDDTFLCTRSYHVNNTAGNASDVVTSTASGGSANWGITVVQVSGCGSGCLLDTSVHVHSAASPIASGSFTTTTAAEIIFAGVGSYYGRTFTAGNIGGTGAALPANGQADNSGNPGMSTAAEYLVVSSIQSSITAAMTTDAGNQYQNMVVSAWKAGSASSPIRHKVSQ
jgi:hypothetical protein